MIKDLNELKEENFYKLTWENAQDYKGKSGVYGLFFNKELIYIGQSKDFSKRLGKHSKKDAIVESLIKQEEGLGNYKKAIAMYEFIDENRDNIFFYILSNDMNEEKYYIKKYKPKYNYKGVDIPYDRNDKKEVEEFRREKLEEIRKLKQHLKKSIKHQNV